MVKEKTEEIQKRGHRKERVGTVISDRQEKTIIVEVERRTAHSLYKKVVKTSKRYVADDQSNEAAIGDKVKIIETRPISKTKRWRLTGIIRKAE